MRIGIDVTSALTQGGGIGRYTRELIHALAQTPFDQAFELTLFSAKPPATLPVPQPLPQHPKIDYRPAPLSEKWLYRLWYRLRLPLSVQRFTGRLALYHSPDFVLPPTGNIPTLLTVHDLSFVHFPHVFTPALVNYLNQVVPWSVGRATHILADSEATKSDLINFWQVPAAKITVLYSGVHPRFHDDHSAEARQQVRQTYRLGEAPYLLAVGTVQPRKNYQRLIEAFKPVAEQSTHKLVIVGGKGWLFDEILDEVERQNLADRVIFTGFVDDADLPLIYSEATALVFPSLYEGFGLPLLEAMACGTPIINSNSSCLPEVAGSATIQLPPEETEAWSAAMLDLINDEAAQNRLRELGKGQVKTFSWEKSAAQLLDIYKGLTKLSR